ncbi:MAG: hypothetical protein ACLP8S_07350 [Solirubrobacteraceae bacterium]
MCPFSVTQNVHDRYLGPLLTQLSHAGFEIPTIKHVDANRFSDKADALARRRTADLPDDWRLLRTRDGEYYR